MNSTNSTVGVGYKLGIRELPEIVIFFLGFFGNMVIIIAICKERLLRSSLNYLVLNLSFCNVLLVIFSIPFQLGLKYNNNDYPFGQGGCKFLYPLATYATNASVMFLLVITIDRYLAIVHAVTWPPHKSQTIRTILIIHVYGLITVIPLMVTTKLTTGEDKVRCCSEAWNDTSKKAYTIILFLLQYAIPLPVMIALYTKAWIHLKKQNDRTIRLSEEARTARSLSMVSEEYPPRRCTSTLRSTYRNEFKYMFLSFCFAPCHYQSLRKEKRRHGSTNSSVGAEYFVANYRRRQTIRTFLIFLLIITVFAVSSLPNQIIWLLRVFYSKRTLPEWAHYTSILLHYANCVSNPFIFGGLSKYFWRAYKRVFFCGRRASRDNFNNTSATFADSPRGTSLREGSSELFKEGIITRNPVIFISAGSMDSVFVINDEDEDEVELSMSEKRVKFKFSNHSNPFRKLSTITTHSEGMPNTLQYGRKKHRKISAALVEDRQRKLTLPVLTDSQICSKEKERIRKTSVPAKVNEKEFVFDDTFALLPPPARKTSNSLSEKLRSLNGPFRKLSTSSNTELVDTDDKKHRKLSKTLAMQDRTRKLTLPTLNERNDEMASNSSDTSLKAGFKTEESNYITEESKENTSLLPCHEKHPTIMKKRKNACDQSNIGKTFFSQVIADMRTLEEHNSQAEELSGGEDSICTAESTLNSAEYLPLERDMSCDKNMITDCNCSDENQNSACKNELNNCGDVAKNNRLIPHLSDQKNGIITNGHSIVLQTDSCNLSNDMEMDLVLEAIKNYRESRCLDSNKFILEHLCGLLSRMEEGSLLVNPDNNIRSDTDRPSNGELHQSNVQCNNKTTWRDCSPALMYIDSQTKSVLTNKTRNEDTKFNFASLEKLPESYI